MNKRIAEERFLDRRAIILQNEFFSWTDNVCLGISDLKSNRYVMELLFEFVERTNVAEKRLFINFLKLDFALSLLVLSLGVSHFLER
jgi:hypothetical protein